MGCGWRAALPHPTKGKAIDEALKSKDVLVSSVPEHSCQCVSFLMQAGVLLGEVCSVEIMDGSFVAGLHDRVTGFERQSW